MGKQTVRLSFAALGLAVGVSLLTATDASAAGCNGVVDQLKWGCAKWDNNNGPQFPHYKKPAAAASQPKVAARKPVAPPKQVVAPHAGSGAAGANGIISGGAGNIISGGAGNVISGGAGNMRK